MSEPALTFKDWLKKRRERIKEFRIRLDTLEKMSKSPLEQTLSGSLLLVYNELSNLYDALERLYENEIEPYKPMLEYLNHWVEERRKEDEARGIDEKWRGLFSQILKIEKGIDI